MMKALLFACLFLGYQANCQFAGLDNTEKLLRNIAKEFIQYSGINEQVNQFILANPSMKPAHTQVLALEDNVTYCADTGFVLFIVNILFPGLGTIISAFCPSDVNVTTILIGLAQLILSSLVVGWIWSVYWGYLLWDKSDN